MDKNAIKKYAVWARKELIARVTQKAEQYEITKNKTTPADADSIGGRVLTAAEKKQRQALIAKINQDGFEQVMEEVAYTWFNRFIALRFMEVNNYLPSHTRVFTNENGEFKPQILADAIQLDLEGLDMEKVYELKATNKTEELYKYLLITQCNALSSIMPGMFQRISDYTELLLPDYLLREGSIIEQMVNQISKEDWVEQVEIIGWLYQYYIEEKHNEVVDVRKKSAITKENVPAATQIFTTDWVVKYMVDNSLGKYWIKSHEDSQIRKHLEYYIDTEEDIGIQNREIGNITFLDPCMGSGHILSYAFDVLLEMYREAGYADKEAVHQIIEKNLYGMDVDDRAFQLAYFSICMKARAIDRRFFHKKIEVNVISIPESNHLDMDVCLRYIDDNDKSVIRYLISFFKDAKEYGTLLQPENYDYKGTYDRLKCIEMSNNATLDEYTFFSVYLPILKDIVKAALMLSKKYTAVCTNPPYHNKYDKKLEKYVLDNYKEAKADLYSVFIMRDLSFCEKDGFSGMMTPHGWLFTKSYEEVRRLVIDTKSISTLVHMAKGAFYSEAAVDICSFVLKNYLSDKKGKYIRLEKFKGDMDVQKQKVLEAIKDSNCSYLYECDTSNYERIDGSPVSYWVTEAIYKDFEIGEPMKKVSPPRQGMATTNNNRFLRMWFEVDYNKIGFGMLNEDMSAESGKKYFPYNKGGEFRRWYGNNYYVVNFQNHGKELCDYIDVTAAPKFNHKNRVINREYYFRECITWSDISADFSGRYCPNGFIFDIKGSSGFPPKDKLLYILGLLNSRLTQAFIDILNPTITTQVGDISRIPIIYGDVEHIESLVQQCVDIGKKLWDSQEYSWDYKKPQLLQHGRGKIKDIIDICNAEYKEDQRQIDENEVEINKSIFNVYDVPNLLDEYEVVFKADESIGNREYITGLISYAVGCMFGRYSLDKPGLVYAGGKWDSSVYKSFQPDKDSIIPICNDEYFEDDIVGRFVRFVEIVFGLDTLEENLTFIAQSLGGKGTSREIIRNYFLNDFYSDHVKTYQKRPIYWLFDSGKKNGFKCLVYMHHYQPDTIARIRTDYVHEQQSRYRTAIADLEQRINGATTSDRVKLNKQLSTLQAQSEEIRKYEEKIHHLADQMISIDLDDGVKHNYAIFKDVLAKIK